MALKICTACGYEGKGKVGPGSGKGSAARVLGILLMLPIHSIWKLATGRSGKYCPHCGTPTMITLSSDAGWLAKRKFEVELGGAVEEKKTESFGRDAPSEPRERKPVDPEQW